MCPIIALEIVRLGPVGVLPGPQREMRRMMNHSTHLRRNLLVMRAVFLGATLLVMGLVPPQEAQSKEKKEKETAQTSSQDEKTTPDENDVPSQDQQEKTTPAEGVNEAQEEKNGEQVLDKDPEGNEVVAGELLVTYKEGAFEKAKDKAPKQVSGKVEKDFPEIEVQHLSVPEAKKEKDQKAREQTLKQKKEDLEQDPDVEAVDYNYVREGSMIPNDTRYSSQWALPNINAPQGWDGTQGSSSVRVAILDSGFNSNHVDLLGKVV